MGLTWKMGERDRGGYGYAGARMVVFEGYRELSPVRYFELVRTDFGASSRHCVDGLPYRCVVRGSFDLRRLSRS